MVRKEGVNVVLCPHNNIHNTTHHYKTPLYTSYVYPILGGHPERVGSIPTFTYSLDYLLKIERIERGLVVVGCVVDVRGVMGSIKRGDVEKHWHS